MIDNELVRKQQIERLSKVKRERDENKAQLCLDNLTEAAKNQLNDTENGNNCLAAAVECARARCTVGEITDAMAKVIFRKNKKNNIKKYSFHFEKRIFPNIRFCKCNKKVKFRTHR